ncbi:hypothetical protein VCR3J2_270014 [Vibrio coralliirubri]|nr:hypothetical protein VCR3J2_270014 [Vibrio coralliirubri]
MLYGEDTPTLQISIINDFNPLLELLMWWGVSLKRKQIDARIGL